MAEARTALLFRGDGIHCGVAHIFQNKCAELLLVEKDPRLDSKEEGRAFPQHTQTHTHTHTHTHFFALALVFQLLEGGLKWPLSFAHFKVEEKTNISDGKQAVC